MFDVCMCVCMFVGLELDVCVNVCEAGGGWGRLGEAGGGGEEGVEKGGSRERTEQLS